MNISNQCIEQCSLTRCTRLSEKNAKERTVPANAAVTGSHWNVQQHCVPRTTTPYRVRTQAMQVQPLAHEETVLGQRCACACGCSRANRRAEQKRMAAMPQMFPTHGCSYHPHPPSMPSTRYRFPPTGSHLQVFHLSFPYGRNRGVMRIECCRNQLRNSGHRDSMSSTTMSWQEGVRGGHGGGRAEVCLHRLD